MEMKHEKNHMSVRCSNHGFTLVELMVALVVSLLALAAIYSTFQAQHKSYQIQSETADMQQNIRTAMYYMQREIRMAGSNPKKTLPLSDFGIQTAGKNTITFTEDVRGPDNSDPSIQDAPDGDVGDPDENITYDLNGTDLRRTDNVTDPTNHPVVAQNIDALDFVYLDESSAPIPFDATDKVAAADLDKIRSVQITIVARTNHSLLYGTKNNNTYVNQQNQAIYTSPVPGGDNISRRLLTTSIHCRNLSL